MTGDHHEERTIILNENDSRQYYRRESRLGAMVFSTTFNNILAILWRSVLLVEETGENRRPVPSHCQTLLHNVVSSTPRMIAYVVFNQTIIRPRRSPCYNR